MTNVFAGRPARALANWLTRELKPGLRGSAIPFAMASLGPLRMEAERQGCSDFSAYWVGEALALARDLPAGTLTHCLADKPPRRM